MSTGRPQLAVLRALGLGDLLTAVPALRALCRAFPEHRRLLLAPSWLRPLLPLIREGSDGCLHGLVEVRGLDADPGKLPQRLELAVNLHGRGPQSHRLLLATGSRRLIAFRNGEAGFESTAHWEPDEHEVGRWCRLLGDNGIEANPAELDIERPEVELPDWMRGATLLHPGAASTARRWPVERWAAVARAELAAGREVIVTGSRKEIGLGRAIARSAGLPPRAQLAGRTDVLGLTALVGCAGTVVCGDTGVAHLATALATPSVLLFGPTSPAHWGPPRERGIHRVLWQGRIGDPHAEAVDQGLLEIDTETVLAALESGRAPAMA